MTLQLITTRTCNGFVKSLYNINHFNMWLWNHVENYSMKVATNLHIPIHKQMKTGVIVNRVTKLKTGRSKCWYCHQSWHPLLSQRQPLVLLAMIKLISKLSVFRVPSWSRNWSFSHKTHWGVFKGHLLLSVLDCPKYINIGPFNFMVGQVWCLCLGGLG